MTTTQLLQLSKRVLSEHVEELTGEEPSSVDLCGVRKQSHLLRHHLQDVVPGSSREGLNDGHHLLVSFPNLSDVLEFARFPEGALVLTTVRVQSLIQLSEMACAKFCRRFLTNIDGVLTFGVGAPIFGGAPARCRRRRRRRVR